MSGDMIKRILITGAGGFIGKNLVLKLLEMKEYELLLFDKENSVEDLRGFISSADFIFHLAGSNRPINESEFREVNYELTEEIIRSLNEYKKQTPVVFSSSTQAELDNPYGWSKREAELALQKFSTDNGGSVIIYRLPNVFGKWCRPNYNSVVATFCNNIANDKPIEIHNPDKELQLVYVDDVVNAFISNLSLSTDGDADYRNIEPIHNTTLGKLAEIIYSFRENRETFFLPDVADQFTKKLYSTYLSYLDKSDFSYKLRKQTDNRGSLTELLKSHKIGQIFVSTTEPGITRGNHYHHTKTEKFIVISGEAEIKFRLVAPPSNVSETDDDAIFLYKVSGDQPMVVDIPPGYTHNITNIGSTPLVTLFWANEVFDPQRPDTIFQKVEP